MANFKITEVLKAFEHSAYHGNAEQEIQRAIGIKDVGAGDASNCVSWINEKLSPQVRPQDIRVGLLVLSASSYQMLKTAKSNFLVVENPRATFFRIVEKFFSVKRRPAIETTAIIDPGATIGKDCYIGHHVVIEKNCRIGNNTVILHNTTVLEGTTIGNSVTIGCNNTIGNYGFGYEKDKDGQYVVLPHTGNVIIHDGVEIHNNTCIDRGVLGSTEIHENVKIDNLVHIAHGVVIGRNSLVIANAMVAGSVIVGENSWIAPSTSIKNQLTIAPDTMTGIGAVVLRNTESGSTYIGNPATTLEEYKRWSAVKKKTMDDKS